eukprot:CAMPEP_0203917844 /NCGR_PEP_ID=MMETSP0359-20131031/58420_1 /ASSEMBLY_ACC=CAM_ASM_000338 /TAXON_ID=268821 /ORGANISM="Scrippsiella Hangoei, Strain SHTV-5" /LENGTH=81 /DNA_ID=CAMNT_0050844823 /DNA_START=113 /DNA_END=354 /DNA_ORIENTATION=+
MRSGGSAVRVVPLYLERIITSLLHVLDRSKGPIEDNSCVTGLIHWQNAHRAAEFQCVPVPADADAQRPDARRRRGPLVVHA